jgi:hypothetical protein
LNAGIDAACTADVVDAARITAQRRRGFPPDIQRHAWLVKALAFTGDVV